MEAPAIAVEDHPEAVATAAGDHPEVAAIAAEAHPETAPAEAAEAVSVRRLRCRSIVIIHSFPHIRAVSVQAYYIVLR